MAFYRKKKLNGKWHLRAVTLGNPAGTDEVAARLSRRSTVSRADCYAVITELGEVMGEFLAEGRSVKLGGVGSFYLSCRTRGCGTDTPEELDPRMISDVKVCFIPEYSRGSNHQVTSRPMVPFPFEWIEVGDKPKKE